MLEHHPKDSRTKIAIDGICQTLTQAMGTGGGNVPLVLEMKDDIESLGCTKQTDSHNRRSRINTVCGRMQMGRQ